MPITLEEVKHIATLARIELTPDELDNYRTQLSSILDYFELLQKLDTAEMLSAVYEFGIQADLRADQPTAGLVLEDLLRNVAEVEENQFRVPPVFD